MRTTALAGGDLRRTENRERTTARSASGGKKKTGRGNIRKARWRGATMTWTTVSRGSNSGEQRTNADDTRREKISSNDTTGTKSWHCNLKDRPKKCKRRRRTAKPLCDSRQQARRTRANRSEASAKKNGNKHQDTRSSFSRTKR